MTERDSTFPALIYCRSEYSVRLCAVTENVSEEVKSRNMVLKSDASTVFKLKSNNRGTTLEPTDLLK